jgi:hypothetical protein
VRAHIQSRGSERRRQGWSAWWGQSVAGSRRMRGRRCRSSREERQGDSFERGREGVARGRKRGKEAWHDEEGGIYINYKSTN